MSILERIFLGEYFLYGTYIDRDLMRAYTIPVQNYIYGPELSIEGRTPGGFYYYILKLIELISFNKIFIIYLFSNLLSFFVSFFIYIKMLKILNIKRNILFLALFTSVGFMYDYSLTFWNPTLTLPFHFLIVYFFISYFLKPSSNSWEIVLSFFLIGLTAQIHLSGLFHIPIFILLIMYTKKSISLKVILSSVGVLLVSYLPLILGIDNYSSALNSTISVLKEKEIEPINTYKLILRIIDYSFSGLALLKNGLREFPHWIFSRGLATYIGPAFLNTLSRGVLFTCLYSLYLSFGKLYSSKSFWRSRHILFFTILIFSFFIYFLIIAFYGDYALNFRRLYPLVPYLFMFISISIKIVIDKAKSPVVKNLFLFLILICLGLNFLNFKLREMPSFSVYSDFKVLGEVAKRDLHLNDSMIKSNIVIFNYNNYKKTCELLIDERTYDSGGIDYLLLGQDDLENISLSKSCYLVMKRTDKKKCAEKLLSIYNPSFANLRPYKEISLFSIYTYERSPCYRSLYNKYLMDI